MNAINIVLALPPAAITATVAPAIEREGAAAAYRLRACARAGVATVGERPGWQCAEVRSTFYFTAAHRLPQGHGDLLEALEPAFDGLVDAGIVAAAKGVMPIPPVVHVGAYSPRVELTIEPPSPNAGEHLLPALAKIAVARAVYPDEPDKPACADCLTCLSEGINVLYPAEVWPRYTTELGARFAWAVRDAIAEARREREAGQ